MPQNVSSSRCALTNQWMSMPHPHAHRIRAPRMMSMTGSGGIYVQSYIHSCPFVGSCMKAYPKASFFVGSIAQLSCAALVTYRAQHATATLAAATTNTDRSTAQLHRREPYDPIRCICGLAVPQWTPHPVLIRMQHACIYPQHFSVCSASSIQSHWPADPFPS